MRGNSYTLKGDNKSLPNIEEVVMGLWQLHCENVRDNMNDKNVQLIDEINDSYREAFDLIMESIGIEDQYSPLTQESLEDPNSKELNLILYLHSMEPAFYAMLNDAC